MKWKGKLISDLFLSLNSSKKRLFTDKLKEIETENISLHLAIFSEPFMTLIFDGQKTMESRFSINYMAPYRKVTSGDLVLMKRPGGPICGFFVAGQVLYFSNLTSDKINHIEESYGSRLCWNIDPEFLSNKSNAKYLSIIEITNITAIPPIDTLKSDRTAWSVIKLGLQNTLFS